MKRVRILSSVPRSYTAPLPTAPLSPPPLPTPILTSFFTLYQLYQLKRVFVFSWFFWEQKKVCIPCLLKNLEEALLVLCLE